jgi:hypothetical protein
MAKGLGVISRSQAWSRFHFQLVVARHNEDLFILSPKISPGLRPGGEAGRGLTQCECR